MKKLQLLMLISLACVFSQAQTVIGHTSYDVQENNGSKHRVVMYADGSVSGLWTGSTDYSGALTFADRGMFYTHKPAAGPWPAFPTTRIEDVRCGFGELLHVGDHEVNISHTTPDGINYNLQLFGNATIGGTTWSELPGSEMITGLWPIATCPAGSDDIYVINTNANPPTELRFSRSDDGGNTWAVLNYTLPFLTAAEGIPPMNTGFNAAETYQIAVHGTDVYVLFGMMTSDIVLLHSASNGAIGTWTSTVIHNFPIDNFTGTVQTDVDFDGITDTIETTDGYMNMLIEDDGTVHVFAGYYRIYEDALAGFWNVDWDATGMWHWKTGMATAALINLELDWDNADGLGDPYAGIGVMRTQYRSAAMGSMPGAAWDAATGHLYLTYTMPIEYTDLFGDPLNISAQSFRDIFGVFSTDGGTTWSTPVDLTNTAESSMENVFTSVYPTVEGGNIHVLWQRDGQPGTAITDFDIVDTNEIVYNEFTPADFGDVPPDLCMAPTGLYADGITTNDAVLHWDIVEGADQYRVALQNTATGLLKKKGFDTNMVEIVDHLDPMTTYGFRVKTVCYDDLGDISPYSDWYYFTTLGRMGDENASVTLFPNPNNGQFTLTLNSLQSNTFDIHVFDAVGHLVYEKSISVDSNSYTETIALDVPAGMYHVLISNENNVMNYPVIIQH